MEKSTSLCRTWIFGTFPNWQAGPCSPRGPAGGPSRCGPRHCQPGQSLSGPPTANCLRGVSATILGQNLSYPPHSPVVTGESSNIEPAPPPLQIFKGNNLLRGQRWLSSPPDTHSVSLPSFPSQLDQLDIEVRREEGSPVYCVYCPWNIIVIVWW